MKNIFSQSEINLDDWHVMTQEEEVNEVIENSKNRPQLVYKHSHTCSVCYIAKKEIEASFEEIRQKADMNFVNVIKARPASDALARQLEVRHESPQVLIINNGEAVWDASHYAIKDEAILEALNSI